MPSKDRWQQQHLRMLGEGKDRARPFEPGAAGGAGDGPERRRARPVAPALVVLSLAVGAWLIWGTDLVLGGVLVVVVGVAGGLFVVATSHGDRS